MVSSAYLVTITKRQQVAQIREKPVFRITDVSLIPLSSRAEATTAITQAQKLLKSSNAPGGSDVGEDADVSTIGTEPGEQTQDHSVEKDAEAFEPSKQDMASKSTIAQDVVQNKGKFGRFATSWFSKTNASQAKSKVSESSQPSEELTNEQAKQEADALPDTDAEAAQKVEEPKVRSSIEKRRQTAIDFLAPRIVRSARLYFSSSGFYFSYDHDLSHALGRSPKVSSTVPLWRRFDSLFFWNQHLMKPLSDAGQDNLILPLIQGFVGQRAFSITQASDQSFVAEVDATELSDLNNSEVPKDAVKHDFHVTLISRRSVKRAGLRYLRRGIDDQGNVANSVETEQILSGQVNDSTQKIFSLLQYRGSMPLFFSQSPYSFKPTPVLFGSEATNQAAFSKHFHFLADRYGDVQAASLIDKHGTEVGIGDAYEKAAKTFNEKGGIHGKRFGFEWFDFHGECKGMKFENVSILMHTLNGFLTSSGFTIEQDEKIENNQSGVLRTNCMDCLDRTNVTQSAVGGWALQQQLEQLGLEINLQSDPKTQWFNTLWADNGDAISKQYAGTSALKGDFTRTRKRNWAGALTDFSLTLNRYYNNIFGDYFMQANIDYFLGATPAVFEEFENDMTTQDYALDMNVIRQNAIDTSVKMVLEENDELISAWTLSSPRKSNTLRSLPFEECVVLLTHHALYHVRFDWNTDKVGSFEKVALADVREIWRGAYITSALAPSHLDESKNYGFAIRYTSGPASLVRTNTRSLGTAVDDASEPEEAADIEGVEQKDMADDSNRGNHTTPDLGETRVLAFKALPPGQSKANTKSDSFVNLGEIDAVVRVTEELRKAVRSAKELDHGSESNAECTVQEHDIISAAEAKKSTSYVESLGYSLKKLVWS